MSLTLYCTECGRPVEATLMANPRFVKFAEHESRPGVPCLMSLGAETIGPKGGECICGATLTPDGTCLTCRRIPTTEDLNVAQ